MLLLRFFILQAWVHGQLPGNRHRCLRRDAWARHGSGRLRLTRDHRLTLNHRLALHHGLTLAHRKSLRSWHSRHTRGNRGARNCRNRSWRRARDTGNTGVLRVHRRSVGHAASRRSLNHRGCTGDGAGRGCSNLRGSGRLRFGANRPSAASGSTLPRTSSTRAWSPGDGIQRRINLPRRVRGGAILCLRLGSAEALEVLAASFIGEAVSQRPHVIAYGGPF
jgi:hypothetical protein